MIVGFIRCSIQNTSLRYHNKSNIPHLPTSRLSVTAIMRVGTKIQQHTCYYYIKFQGEQSTVSRPQLAYMLFLAFGRNSEDTCCRSRGIEQLDFKADHLCRHTASKVHGNIGVALRHTQFQTNPPSLEGRRCSTDMPSSIPSKSGF